MLFIFLVLNFIQSNHPPWYNDIMIVNAILENQLATTFQEFDEIGVMFDSDSIAGKLYNHPQKIGNHYLLEDLGFIGCGIGLVDFAGILVHDYKKIDSEATVEIEVWDLKPSEIRTYDVLLDSLNLDWKIKEYVFKGSRPRKN